LSSRQDVLRRAYAAFNSRDIDAALELMHPDVDWPNGMDGGRERGRKAVRAYWERQLAVIDSKVEPEEFEEAPEGRIAVTVHQVVHSPEGGLVSDSQVRHVYEFEGDLVVRMEIE
jgi:ketosteroid isomerase-like protein